MLVYWPKIHLTNHADSPCQTSKIKIRWHLSMSFHNSDRTHLLYATIPWDQYKFILSFLSSKNNGEERDVDMHYL